MAKGLIIVESPAKASTISKFLQNRFDIKASMGHIRDLPVKELGVDVDSQFKAKYVIDSKKKKLVEELRKAAKEADAVYLASDPDREGEAIAWHLAAILAKETKGKPVKRVVFNEITKNAVQQAMEHPGEIDQNKVEAQQARRILDRLVGYKVSPLLWKIITKDLSAGRVQSVALRLICERDNEISLFVPVEYWSVEADFYKGALKPFHSVLEKWQGKKVDMIDQTAAEKIEGALHDKEIVLKKLTKAQRKIEPQPAFITSTLQQEASRILNMAAQKTMKVAQELYEGVAVQGESTGLISYMRTDSLRISEEANQHCRELIKERFGTESLQNNIRVFANKNKAQDAHEAIRPTDPFRSPEMVAPYLSKEQLQLYTLIWQRFIATQMKPAQLSSVTLKIEVGEGLFSSTGSTLDKKGFLEVYPHVSVSLGEEIDERYQESDELSVLEKYLTKQHFTKPPARFSEASLIKELEALGIGRPSTYATIIQTIRDRNYVELIKKQFFSTDLGKAVNKFLVKSFDEIFNITFTAEMENRLDEIEYGQVMWQQLLDEYYKHLTLLLDNVGQNIKEIKKEFVEDSGIKCDKCEDGKMMIRWGQNGQFLSCSNYPKCLSIMNFKRGEDGKIEVQQKPQIEEKCPECGGDLQMKRSRFGEFIGCSNYPKCKFTKSIGPEITCPKCHTGRIVEKRGKSKRKFYACTGYPACDFISNYPIVNQKCPDCGNEYLEERVDKNYDKALKCPKCNKEFK